MNGSILRFQILLILFLLPLEAICRNAHPSGPERAPPGAVLSNAVMCEEVKEHSPQNQSMAFSVTLRRVICFTAFDPVPKKTFVYHEWYRRDRLSTRVRLSLQPPRWSTFSRIQLREADKGPWRVEIKDKENNILQILRFSITD